LWLNIGLPNFNLITFSNFWELFSRIGTRHVAEEETKLFTKNKYDYGI
jgi:D-tyrosyl-tRNA(Tyr) deacylase